MYYVAVAAGFALAIYLLDSWYVRSRFRDRRRSDNPMTRVHALDTAAVDQVAAVFRAGFVAVGAVLGSPLLFPSAWAGFAVSVGTWLVGAMLIGQYRTRRYGEIRRS